MTTLIVDMYTAPRDWGKAVAAIGIHVEKSESHPIADCVKLIGCTNISDELPNWLRVKKP